MTIKNTTSPQTARIGRQFTASTTPGTMPAKQNKDAVLTRIISEFKDRNRKDIQTWRKALALAGDPNDPRMYLLQDLYDDLETDGHLESQTNLRRMATLGYDSEVINQENGEADTETQKLLSLEWFYDFVKMVLSYPEKGPAVLELQDPVNLVWEMIPRRNVVPQRKFIFFEVNGDKGISYAVGFENSVIQIGKAGDLGYFNKIIPSLIWKRNAQQSWAEFSEKFGMPLVTATSNKTNDKDLDRLDRLLASLGEAARAVMPAGTTIDVKPFVGSDSYKVYDMQIERCNSEISKVIVGGTMLSDNGSSQSQANVHERNLDDKIAEADRKLVEFIVNGYLFPLLRRIGYNIPETSTFRYMDSFDLDLNDHWKIVNEALQRGINIDMDWVSRTFNFPIDSKNPISKPVTEPAKPTPSASFFV
ncbi:phage portal protein family protein [Pelobium manganitolerans]|uniref:phage portal protein family protein n=1 Tax=Pelobium manganitolerans TaxID=1842495 RepID=UPI003FA3BBF4